MPAPEKPKQVGPLIDFNRHPDSYKSKPYGVTDVAPMGSWVKPAVKYTRLVQLILRILGLIGCIGILVGAIFLRNTTFQDGCMIRIPVSEQQL